MNALYRSPNGDTWFLIRDPATGLAFVRHQANAASGGQVTDIDVADFLDGPQSPERDALLRVIGAAIGDPLAAAVEAVNAGREWSDAELSKLGDLLLCGLSIEEIAPLLGRDQHEVRDKVAEVGRACL